MAAAELVADRDATLRELDGEIAPVAAARHDANTMICPDRDAPARRNDRVTAVGPLEQFSKIFRRSAAQAGTDL